MNLIRNIKKNNYLTTIIYINIGLFVLINFCYVFLFLFQEKIDIISYLGVSANLNTLIQKPWTLITYMFVHKNLMHIVINLFWLYFGGKIFINYLSEKNLLSTYFMGGIVGAIHTFLRI